MEASSRRHGKSRLAGEGRLRQYVLQGLRKEWSPREIQKRLEKEYSFDTHMHISHEAIYRYRYVLPKGELKRTLVKALRYEHAYRRKRRNTNTKERRGKIADMLSIEERPTEVADRSVPGHGESDLILGRHKRTALGTLVERTTRYTLLVYRSARRKTQYPRDRHMCEHLRPYQPSSKDAHVRPRQGDERTQTLHR